MSEARRDPNFKVEELTKTFVSRVFRSNHLEGDWHVENDIVRTPDDTHAPLSQEGTLRIQTVPRGKLDFHIIPGHLVRWQTS